MKANDGGDACRMGLQMPDSKTYTGGCHCGQVRFECTTDMAFVTACNCSICTKKGLHFTFISPQRFQRCERTFLIRPHQARVARDVGRQNRRQAPLDPFLRHGAVQTK